MRTGNTSIQTRFPSGNKTITLERFTPHDDKSHPAIILLHGAEGVHFGPWANRYRKLAKALNEFGYTVFIPHYFQKTGTIFTNTPDIIRNFETWRQTVVDCIGFVLEQPGIAGAGVGLIGFSLGASLVVTTAAQDARVAVAVDVYGAVPDFISAIMQNMPPTLILHGSRDFLVPVTDAYKLEKLLRNRGHLFDLHIYEGEGHGFSDKTNKDAFARARQFLESHFPPYIHSAEAQVLEELIDTETAA